MFTLKNNVVRETKPWIHMFCECKQDVTQHEGVSSSAKIISATKKRVTNYLRCMNCGAQKMFEFEENI